MKKFIFGLIIGIAVATAGSVYAERSFGPESAIEATIPKQPLTREEFKAVLKSLDDRESLYNTNIQIWEIGLEAVKQDRLKLIVLYPEYQ